MASDTDVRARARTALIALAVVGLCLEFVLVMWFLLPFSIWAHPTTLDPAQTIPSVLGFSRGSAIRFACVIVVAFAVYGLAISYARRVAGRRGFALVLGGVVLFSVTLLPMNPVGAQDVFHNVADARTLWIYGDNPAVVPPDGHPEDPFHQYVHAWTDYPSSYGPLWYLLSGAPIPITGPGLWPSVIGQKVLTAVFLLASTALVMMIVGRTRPGAAATAGVLVGWNPLLLFDTAGNAHNDIVMMTFALAAFYVIVRERWLAVFYMLALAVAVKWVLVLLGPILLLWMWQRKDIPRRTIFQSLGLGALASFALYLPFGVSGDLVFTLTEASDPILSSTGAAFTALLIAHRGLDPDVAGQVARRVLSAIFLVIYAGLLWRMRRDTTFGGLVNTSAWTLFAFLVVAKWWFWAWYLIWLVPLAALVPHRWIAVTAVAFSLSAMLMNAVYFWRVYDDWVTTQQQVAAVIFIFPVLVAAVPLVERVLRQRRGAEALASAGGASD